MRIESTNIEKGSFIPASPKPTCCDIEPGTVISDSRSTRKGLAGDGLEVWLCAYIMTNVCHQVSNSLRVWDNTRGGWAQSYPAMPSPRLSSASVGYQHYLIVPCRSNSGGVDTVAILLVDGSSHRWYNVQPVPMGDIMSSVVIYRRLLVLIFLRME